MKLKETEKYTKKSSKTFLDIYGDWTLTDSSLEDITEGTKTDVKKETGSTPETHIKHEVYHEPVFNKNFIIVSYPVTVDEDGDYRSVELTCEYMYDELGNETYGYMANVLQHNRSTIVHCHDGHCDIYYNAWDIESCINGLSNYTYKYLKTLMVADGLEDCKYPCRDIRKGIVFPTAFQWEGMKPEEYKTLIEDRGIIKMIHKSYEELMNRRSLYNTVELYLEGKHSLYEVSAMTGRKRWEIIKALKDH